MAKEKKPSIFVDRGTIGSPSELDEYGVWVKSEPQDLVSPGMGETAELSAEFTSFSSGDISDIDDMDFEVPEFSESFDSDELPDFDAPQEEAYSGDTDDLNGTEVIDDTVSFELPDDDFELPDADAESIELSESIDSAESLGSAEPPDSDVFLDEDTEDDGNVFNFGDLTGQIDSLEDSNTDDFAESFDSVESTETADDIELIDLSDMSDFSEDSVNEKAEEGFTEVPIDDIIETIDIGADIDESADASEDISIDLPVDIYIDEDASPEQTAPAAQTAAPADPHTQDLSTQLLMKIAEELASIRAELSTLKMEFSGLQSAAPTKKPNEGKDDFYGQEDDEKISLTGAELINILNTADFTEEAGADAGDDLTDDLSVDLSEDMSIPEMEDTAVSFPEENEPDIDIALESLDSIDEMDLEELEGESITFDTPAEVIEDSISFEEPIDTDFFSPENEDDVDVIEDSVISEESFPDFLDEEPEEIRKLMEEGAQPMAFAPSPEDEKYLEEQPLTGNILEEDSLDLSEAVIDEPDLSSEIQEHPLEEPSIDDISIDDISLEGISIDDISIDEISIDLDMSEAESDDFVSEDADLEELSIADNSDSEEMSLDVEPLDIEPFESADIESEEGGDLSLIPENFYADSEETAGSEESAGFEQPEAFPGGSADLQSADLQSADLQSEDEFIPEGELEAFDSDSALEDLPEFEEFDTAEEPVKGSAPVRSEESKSNEIPSHLKQELKTVLSYMDQLLESLPDEKIDEFARSEYYETYKKLFKELGIV